MNEANLSATGDFVITRNSVSVSWLIKSVLERVSENITYRL